MQANRNRLGLGLGFFWSAVAVLAFAAPAQSQVVVQYTATIISGFGDGPGVATTTPFSGGTPPTGIDPGGSDLANNGIPACNKIPLGTKNTATQAKVSFAGLATVTAMGPAPRSVAFPKANNAIGMKTTCLSVQTVPPAQNPTMRTQSSSVSWPGTSGSFKAGGGFAGSTGAPFSRVGFFQTAQGIKATTIGGGGSSPKFGGALRANGLSLALLHLRLGGGTILTGALPFKLNFGASVATLPGMTTVPGSPVVLTSTNATFFVKGAGIPVGKQTASQEFMPWTTGVVKVQDRVGQFWTFRTVSGMDNRNPAGTSGTLQLVTPALAAISGAFLNVPFALTSVLTFTFTPEPGATLLLAAGAFTLLGLHAVRRHRS
jgi:hypothetical protein